jgi:CubicO group peptidase (beta-lactamase class C family)
MAVSPSVLGKVIEVFERNFRDRGELGASISIWWSGVELISEGHGWCERENLREWTDRTLVPVYSATKVPSAATLLLALESKGLSPETPVREVWPAFPVADAKFFHLLSHQCGLPVLDQKASIFEHAEVVAAIEAQAPAWALGDGHGYHPRTFGALVDEPVRRLTGKTLGTYWRERVAAPLGLDFWIGLPEKECPRQG